MMFAAIILCIELDQVEKHCEPCASCCNVLYGYDYRHVMRISFARGKKFLTLLMLWGMILR
jgi:hypothetical protein